MKSEGGPGGAGITPHPASAISPKSAAFRASKPNTRYRPNKPPRLLVSGADCGIDAALKGRVEVHRPMIGEGQDLRHDDAGQSALRIEPVIGVEDAGPCDAAGAAPVGARLRRQHIAKTPAHRLTGKEVDVVGQRRIVRLQDAG